MYRDLIIRLRLARVRNMSMFYVSVTVFLCSVLRWQNNLICTLVMYCDVYIQQQRLRINLSCSSIMDGGGGEMHDGNLFTRAGYCHEFTATQFDIPVRIAISPSVEQRRSPSMCAVSGQSIYREIRRLCCLQQHSTKGQA